jgi:hypothetical protein
MDTLLAEYEKSRAQLITWFGKKILCGCFLNIFSVFKESVKETQRVTIDEIPMPELPHESTPSLPDKPRSILKQKE